MRLTPSTVLLLIAPTLMWAINAIVGRLVADQIPPLTLNFIRWLLALIILIPLGRAAFTQGSGLLRHWRHYALLGLSGVGLYNGLQYLALHTSTPVNVTLVSASMPVWMLVIGAVFFRHPISMRQAAGALASILGVMLVLSQGHWQELTHMRFVAGDLYMVIATIVWSFYSWLLASTRGSTYIGQGWAPFLLAQVLYGTLWSGLFAGLEWALTDWVIHWSGSLVAALVYVTLGPALMAFWCWGAGVRRAGPSVAAVFYNFTPVFAAILSALFLGEPPRVYHGFAFLFIVGGIALSMHRSARL